MGLPASIQLGALNGTDGFRANGAAAGDRAGEVSEVGDFNGDGYDDFLVAAEAAFGFKGAAYLVFGRPQGFPAVIELSAVDGTNGFRMDAIALGDSGSEAKHRIGGAGDLNGDGLADLVFGAPGVNAGSGAAYVVFGHAGATPAVLSMADLNGQNGFAVTGVNPGSETSFATGSAGDVNGDGIDDLFVSYRNSPSGPGGGMVIFGRTGGFAATFDPASLNGANGFRIVGDDNGSFGRVMTGGGDLNGDGFDDVVIGAPSDDPEGRDSAGSVYVVFGKASFSASVNVSGLNGVNGFRLDGPDADDNAGETADFAGDINGDGFDDLLIGAPAIADFFGREQELGAVFVVYGKAQPFAPVLNLGALNGQTGFRINGRFASDNAGEDGTEAAGDVNGDGLADFLVETGVGTFDVILGRTGPFAAVNSLNDVSSTTITLSLASGGSPLLLFGSGGGDINGDGVDDILIGAPRTNYHGADTGAVFGVFGQADLSAGATAGADVLGGGAGVDRLSAGGGADSLQGLGANDRLLGGAGADKALYAGTALQYEWWSTADGWLVKDLRAGSPEGTDTLLSVETLQFSDKSVKILGLTTAERLTAAYENILRGVATGGELTFLNGLIGAVNGSTKTLGAAITEIVAKADQTTAVAAMSYQFFLNFVPSKGGFDYLVSPQGPNANNINSAYYQSFNIENRYINFAVNLGKAGEGAPSFLAEYGAKTLFQATKDAYMEIFGGTVVDSKINTILDSSVGSMSRAQYFALYGGDGLTGIGTKAAMVGWLLTEAAKADLGMYANSSNAFLTDLADGAQTLVDVVGTYGQSDYVFNG